MRIRAKRRQKSLNIIPLGANSKKGGDIVLGGQKDRR